MLRESFGPFHLMFLALGHVHKCREIALCLETEIQFYSPFSLSECGPGKNSAAEIYSCDVEKIDLTLEFKLVLRRMNFSFLQEFKEYSTINLVRLMCINPGKSSSTG